MVKRIKIEVHMDWIRTHVRHTFKERTDVLAKDATIWPEVELEVKATHSQAKRELFDHALFKWHY